MIVRALTFGMPRMQTDLDLSTWEGRKARSAQLMNLAAACVEHARLEAEYERENGDAWRQEETSRKLWDRWTAWHRADVAGDPEHVINDCWVCVPVAYA